MRPFSSLPLRYSPSVLLTPQLLAFATDELSIRVGETLAGLLNATLVRTSFPRPSFGSPKLTFACRVTRECSRQRRPWLYSNRFRTLPRFKRPPVSS